MKIAITSAGSNLEAQVDPRFGRCQYLLFVDTESLQFEAVRNPNVAAGGGAGVQTAQMVAAKQVEAVVTGNAGPNAYQTLSAAGVKVYTGATGTVRQAIEAFGRGELQEAAGPSVGSHFGAGGAVG
jgi:predicted Fe-Mo cluster-binding NifX family protein